MPNLDWSQCKAVESVPGKMSGAWVFKGTRMQVQTAFANLEAGATVDELLEWFDGLERGQVEAVLHFVASSLEKEPIYAESVDEKTRLFAAIDKGIDAAARGEFLEEDEMDARLEAMFKA